jgi:hypothetical protein
MPQGHQSGFRGTRSARTKQALEQEVEDLCAQADEKFRELLESAPDAMIIVLSKSAPRMRKACRHLSNR